MKSFFFLKSLIFFLLILLLKLKSISCHSILDFGGIPNNVSSYSAHTNVNAIKKAFYVANTDPNDRTVLIPPNQSFYFAEVALWNLHNVTLQIDGVWLLSNDFGDWPFPDQVNHSLAGLFIGQSSLITITGSGMIDGQGYDWWWATIILERDRRPHMISMNEVSGIYIDIANVQNSPQFHFLLTDVENVVVRNTIIYVDLEAQQKIFREKRRLLGVGEDIIPTFPLNTDGIDPAGVHVLIENVTIENYDDAVAVKPCQQGWKYCNCSSDMLIRNCRVTMGVGMTIGSVPPNPRVNCVRDITFQDITFRTPFKAMYIKTNPGNEGTGIIDNIIYKNIFVDGALWYPM